MESDSIGIERRRLPFTLVENIVLEDPELGPFDILVYLALAKHADAEGTCWPSLTTIGKVAHCGRTAVVEGLKHLEARGYLKRTARFRPDGGVSSNSYQLLRVTAARHPPVRLADPPRPGDEPAPVRLTATNYIQSEPNSKKKEREGRPENAPPLPVDALSEPPSLPSLLRKIQEEAKNRGAPLIVGKDWSRGVAELIRSGIPEEELLMAFVACIETDGGARASYFPRDFLKWRKASKKREKGEGFCPECGIRGAHALNCSDRPRDKVTCRDCGATFVPTSSQCPYCHGPWQGIERSAARERQATA